jgi:hypothetical protein
MKVIMERYGTGMVAGEAPFKLETTQLGATVIRVQSTERILSVVPFSSATALQVALPATVSGGWTASIVRVQLAPLVPDAEFLSRGGVATWLRSAGGDSRELGCADDRDFCVSITQRISIRINAGDAASDAAQLTFARKIQYVKARLGLRCLMHVRAGNERRAGLSSDTSALPNAAEPGWFWSDDYCQAKSAVLDEGIGFGTVRCQAQSIAAPCHHGPRPYPACAMPSLPRPRAFSSVRHDKLAALPGALRLFPRRVGQRRLDAARRLRRGRVLLGSCAGHCAAETGTCHDPRGPGASHGRPTLAAIAEQIVRRSSRHGRCCFLP